MQFERHVLFWTASALLFAYLVQLLTLLVAATTVASLVAYLRIWLRHMTVYESTGSNT